MGENSPDRMPPGGLSGCRLLPSKFASMQWMIRLRNVEQATHLPRYRTSYVRLVDHDIRDRDPIVFCAEWNSRFL
jgi:hypothetical protein